MKLNILLLSALILTATHVAAQSEGPSAARATGDYFIYVGSYTNPTPKTENVPLLYVTVAAILPVGSSTT